MSKRRRVSRRRRTRKSKTFKRQPRYGKGTEARTRHESTRILVTWVGIDYPVEVHQAPEEIRQTIVDTLQALTHLSPISIPNALNGIGGLTLVEYRISTSMFRHEWKYHYQLEPVPFSL